MFKSWTRLFAFKKKLVTVFKGNPEAPFSVATTRGVRKGDTPFPGLLHFTLDTYIVMLSVKQVGIKYHFLSLWYDSTWDGTQVSGPLANTLPTRAMSRYLLRANALEKVGTPSYFFGG